MTIDSSAFKNPGRPLVSVIIPTFNCPEFLKAAIESVLAQAYTELEVVVVDDGSTDNTPEVVRQFKDRVRYVHQNNAGTAAARNTGIKSASGEVIAFLDHDDLWLPGKLERQIPPLLGDESVGMVFCGRQFFNTYTNEVTSTHPAESELKVHDFLAHTTIALQSAIMRRTIFVDVGVFDENLLGTDDWEMCIRIAEKYRVIGVPDVLVSIRGHEGQQGIMTERMYTNSMSVLTKHANIHANCRQCMDAVRRSNAIIRQDYYQRYRRQAKTDFAERRIFTGIKDLAMGLRRYPQAITRVPQRLLQRLTGA
jgi:glycosyltransferase involved in cell wall biosynthesis